MTNVSFVNYASVFRLLSPSGINLIIRLNLYISCYHLCKKPRLFNCHYKTCRIQHTNDKVIKEEEMYVTQCSACATVRS